MKTNKHLTLLLVSHAGVVRAKDLVSRFEYSPGTARSYLSYLAKHGVLERTARGYTLSEKGKTRLQFFETMGCGSLDCPLCLAKQANYYTCPRCGNDNSKDKVKFTPEWDTLFFKREAGVYCLFCQTRIFTEEQAKQIGIKREE